MVTKSPPIRPESIADDSPYQDHPPQALTGVVSIVLVSGSQQKLAIYPNPVQAHHGVVVVPSLLVSLSGFRGCQLRMKLVVPLRITGDRVGLGRGWRATTT